MMSSTNVAPADHDHLSPTGSAQGEQGGLPEQSGLLDRALNHLRQIPQGATPLLDAILGLDLIVRVAIQRHSMAKMVTGSVEEISDVIRDAAASIARVTGGSIQLEHIGIGFDAAYELMCPNGEEDGDLTYGRTIRALFLLAELQQRFCEQEFARLGNPVDRIASAYRAQFMTPKPAGAMH